MVCGIGGGWEAERPGGGLFCLEAVGCAGLEPMMEELELMESEIGGELVWMGLNGRVGSGWEEVGVGGARSGEEVLGRYRLGEVEGKG